MNEVLRSINEYLLGDSVRYFGEGNGIRFVGEMFQNGCNVFDDAPDMYIVNGNDLLIIEHFEFDCYKFRSKKGSESRIEQARIDRKENSIVATKEGVIYHDVINGDTSYENYIRNVTRSFLEHYSQIPAYIRNIVRNSHIVNSENMRVKVLFLIEDTSPVGSNVYEKGTGIYTINLAHSREFLDLLESHERVDYVFSCAKCLGSDEVWFIDRNEIQRYREDEIDYASMRFLACTPHVLGGKMLLDRECED